MQQKQEEPKGNPMEKFFFTADGPADLSKFKFVAYYFGASWSKDCKNFTRHLQNFYG